jgi:hypothetical protein
MRVSAISAFAFRSAKPPAFRNSVDYLSNPIRSGTRGQSVLCPGSAGASPLVLANGPTSVIGIRKTAAFGFAEAVQLVIEAVIAS